MKKRHWIIGIFLIMIFISVQGTHAANICVHPTRPSCAATIQDAVDAAMPGDNIWIKRGKYFENVVIPVGKNNITIQGMYNRNKVVVDPDDPNTGPAFTVEANKVKIKNLTIKNGESSGVLVAATADGTQIINLYITGPAGDCIDVDGANTLIKKAYLKGCGSEAVDVAAHNVTIKDSSMINCDNDCIKVIGDDFKLTNNVIQVADDSECVDVSGDNAKITDNFIEICDGNGIELDGNNFEVLNNVVYPTSDDGYEIDCTPCTYGLIKGNSTFGAMDDEGFNIRADAPGLEVENNISSKNGNSGFLINGTGIVLRGNKSFDNGGDNGEHGFEISGTGHTLMNNLARGNHGDGFHIRSENHILDGNTAISNIEDGFDVQKSGLNIQLLNNVARNNNGMGIEISGDPAGSDGATNTFVDGNTAKMNRTDFCDQGVGTVEGTNNFGTTGPCVIDDDD